jgi:membrane associated rhomboid family serine protease
MSTDPRHEPAIRAPAIVVIVLALLVGIHLVRQFIGPGLDEWVLTYLAFSPARFSEIGRELPGPSWLAFTSMVTHTLVHGDWTHLIFNGAWFLAFGSIIARRTSALGFLALFAVCAIAGAIAFWLDHIGEITSIVGASGAISGLMGAAFRILFSALDWGGIHALQNAPQLVPRMPLIVALQDRRVVMGILMWVAINLLFGIVIPGVFTESGIAWEAHLGGFVAGFLLFDFFDRGRGWEPSHPDDLADTRLH